MQQLWNVFTWRVGTYNLWLVHVGVKFLEGEGGLALSVYRSVKYCVYHVIEAYHYTSGACYPGVYAKGRSAQLSTQASS